MEEFFLQYLQWGRIFPRDFDMMLQGNMSAIAAFSRRVDVEHLNVFAVATNSL